MISSVERAKELKRDLDGIWPLSKEMEERIFQKFRLEWNYHSNSIEGNSLTYGETKALILFNITAQGKPLKDHFEITGHDEALKWILEIVNGERDINESFIRQLHELLHKESYEVDALTPDGKPTKKKIQVGSYKTTPNHVRTNTGEIFRFAEPEETPAKMNDLIRWYENSKLDPIIKAAEFHYKFILIHPFDDGNGRTARILMNFILLKGGYPPAIIRTSEKEEYFRALRLADSGQLTPFIEFIANSIVDSLELMIRGATGGVIEERTDIDKEIELLKNKYLNAGKSIKKMKSEEVVKDLLVNGLGDFIERFFNRVQGFNDFYITTINKVNVNKTSYPYFDKETFRELVKGLEEDIDFLSVVAEFSQPRIAEHIDETFRCGIVFEFNKSTINIRTFHHKTPTVKKYHEKIGIDEIDTIINLEMSAHKQYIEEKFK